MLLREERQGVLAITQPAHAALAGALAAAWDDELAPALVLAAAHHDDVWAARDDAPRLGGGGCPQTFLELSPAERLAVWGRAPEVAAPLGPEAELWVLRHAERLHAGYDDAALAAMAAGFGARIAALALELQQTQPGRFDAPELARGTSLLKLWDTLSLRLCFGVGAPVDAGVLRLVPDVGGAVVVAPWPFTGRRLDTSFQARRLAIPVAGQAELEAAWAAAEPFAVPVTLLAPG